jgi:hypothetical protein
MKLFFNGVEFANNDVKAILTSRPDHYVLKVKTADIPVIVDYFDSHPKVFKNEDGTYKFTINPQSNKMYFKKADFQIELVTTSNSSELRDSWIQNRIYFLCFVDYLGDIHSIKQELSTTIMDKVQEYDQICKQMSKIDPNFKALINYRLLKSKWADKESSKQ